MASRGWFFVLLGILISSFLGGAIYVFFSPDRMREFVESVITEKKPKFLIDFKTAKLQFADNWWPTVAIELDDITVKAIDSCITNSTLHIDRLIIPFQLSSLFIKKIRFGHVHAGNVQFLMRPSSCAKINSNNNSNNEFVLLESFFQNRWSKEVVNTTRLLSKLSIESLVLLQNNESLAPAIIKSFSVQFIPKRAESIITFDIHLGKPWVGDANFGPVRSKMILRSNEVQFTGRGNLKEGQFKINSEWAVDRGEINFNASAKDLPANSILKLAHNWGILNSFNPVIKNQWANCDLSFNGNIHQIKLLLIRLNQCRLYGDLGEIVVNTNTIKNLTEGGPLNLQIEDIDMKRVLGSFAIDRSWGFVSQFGRFTGDLTIIEKNKLSFAGELRQSEIYMSRGGLQTRQKIDSAQISILLLHDKYFGEAKNIYLASGECHVEIKFNFLKSGDGKFDFDIKKLIFSNEVQKILWGGTVSESSLVGSGEIINLNLSRINASLWLKDLKTLNWELKSIKARTTYENGKWNLYPSAEKFQLHPESKWGKAFYQILANIKPHINDLSLQNISAYISLSEDGGTWQNLKATTIKHSVKIIGAGQWKARDKISGELTVKGPSHEELWNLSGNWQTPQVKSKAAAIR
ncbi:MAG: hypothetical protein A2Z20_09515 [Bdellovibrionales bacterium RBG_16_40_8]|nr:MAG: hypothetical protein A2Z20_09515 [Bdellovibrionales bacterium RBG_16_40_8]